MLTLSFIFFLSFFSCLFFTAVLIKYLKKLSLLQPIYDLAPKMHKKKARTPTMGGIAFVMVAFFLCVLFYKYLDTRSWVTLFALASFGLIGFLDDYTKIRSQKNLGLRPKKKLFLQALFGFCVVFAIYFVSDKSEFSKIDFFKIASFKVGLLYYAFAAFIIIGTSNAVNLTDGLDGLAGFLSISSLAPLFFIAINTGNHQIALPIASAFGGLLAFLWFNAKPAQIFMGDTGSLALGAFVATIAILLKLELYLIFFCALFVAETLSVILQVFYFKISSGKRIFKMAPLHHHFELSGISEEKIAVRFLITSVAFSIAGLLLYNH